jgi:hypothetical protein
MTDTTTPEPAQKTEAPPVEETPVVVQKTKRPKKIISDAARAAHVAKFAPKRKPHDPTLVRKIHLRSLARKCYATIMPESSCARLNRKNKARIAFIVPRAVALMQNDPCVTGMVLERHIVAFMRMMGMEVYG